MGKILVRAGQVRFISFFLFLLVFHISRKVCFTIRISFVVTRGLPSGCKCKYCTPFIQGPNGVENTCAVSTPVFTSLFPSLASAADVPTTCYVLDGQHNSAAGYRVIIRRRDKVRVAWRGDLLFEWRVSTEQRGNPGLPPGWLYRSHMEGLCVFRSVYDM